MDHLLSPGRNRIGASHLDGLHFHDSLLENLYPDKLDYVAPYVKYNPFSAIMRVVQVVF